MKIRRWCSLLERVDEEGISEDGMAVSLKNVRCCYLVVQFAGFTE